MPPKSSKGKASAGGAAAATAAAAAAATTAAANESYYEEQRMSDAVTAASLRLQALQQLYLDQVRMLASRRQEQEALQQHVDVVQCTLADKRDEHMDVLTDYVRQNKAEEQDTIARIVALDTALTQRHEERRRLQRQHAAQVAELEQAIKAQQDAHEALRKRGAEMEHEFALMLADIENSTHASSDASAAPRGDDGGGGNKTGDRRSNITESTSNCSQHGVASSVASGA